MNYFLKSFLYLLLSLPLVSIGQNDKTLSLSLGLNNFTMLDRQASPVVYELNAPIAQLGYQHKNPKRTLVFDAYFSLGQLKANDNNLPTLDTELELSTTAAGLDIQYWKPLNTDAENWQQMLGGSFQYDFMIDFEAVGDFPWAMGQASLGIHYGRSYLFKNGNRLGAKIGIPVVSILTRMSYYNIPRTQGKVPGVGSFLAEGTKLATWNNFQRIDFSLIYQFQLNERWQLQASYQFVWFHYSLSDDIFAYQQQLTLQLGYAF